MLKDVSLDMLVVVMRLNVLMIVALVMVVTLVVNRLLMVVRALMVVNGFFMIVCTLMMVNRLLVMHDRASVMVVLPVARVFRVTAAANLMLLVVRLRGLGLNNRLGLLLLGSYLYGLWAAGTRATLMACTLIVMGILLVIAVIVRVGIGLVLRVVMLLSLVTVSVVLSRLSVRVFIVGVRVKSVRLLNHMVEILITGVLRVPNLLVGLLNLTGLALVSEYSAALLTPELLLLLLTLPHFLVCFAAEERLLFVAVMVKIKLLLAHVRVSEAEFIVLFISVPLFIFNVTHHLRKLELVLGACIFNFSLIQVSFVLLVVVGPVVRLTFVRVVAAVVSVMDGLLVVSSLSMVRVLVVAWGLSMGPVVVTVAVLVIIVVLVATLVLLVLLLLQGLLSSLLPGLVGVLVIVILSVVNWVFLSEMLATVMTVVRSLFKLLIFVLGLGLFLNGGLFLGLSDLVLNDLVSALVFVQILLILSPIGLRV